MKKVARWLIMKWYGVTDDDFQPLDDTHEIAWLDEDCKSWIIRDI